MSPSPSSSLPPSPQTIEASRSPSGGWTRATLASWGVPWPPPKGWRRALDQAWRETQGVVPSGRSTSPLDAIAAHRSRELDRQLQLVLDLDDERDGREARA